jgi:hypothetical protein
MVKKNRLNPVRPTEPILPKQAEENPKSKEKFRNGRKLHHKKESDSANDEESTSD